MMESLKNINEKSLQKHNKIAKKRMGIKFERENLRRIKLKKN
jgi:hypothetical protein